MGLHTHRSNALRLIVIAIAGGAGLAPAASAAMHGHMDAAEYAVVHAADLVWEDGPDSLPVGARVATLSGNASAKGPFTIRLETPPGYVVPPHMHMSTERVTVLEGTARLGLGDGSDPGNVTDLEPLDFYVMPAGMAHWFEAGNETVVLQLEGKGPWGIEYVDPGDDPRVQAVDGSD